MFFLPFSSFFFCYFLENYIITPNARVSGRSLRFEFMQRRKHFKPGRNFWVPNQFGVSNHPLALKGVYVMKRNVAGRGRNPRTIIVLSYIADSAQYRAIAKGTMW